MNVRDRIREKGNETPARCKNSEEKKWKINVRNEHKNSEEGNETPAECKNSKKKKSKREEEMNVKNQKREEKK